MDRLTTGLIVAAVAIGMLANRDARRSGSKAVAALDGAQPAPTPRKPAAETMDQGMVVLRNGPIDNGMVVRSPFKGDQGITRPPQDDAR